MILTITGIIITATVMKYEDVKLYQQNIEEILSQEGATPSDVVDAMDFQKDSLKENIEKCYKTRENYAHAADVIKAEMDVLNAKMKLLKERAAGFKAKADTLDEIIKVAMNAMGEDSIFLPTVTIEMKTSTPKVEIDDEDAVPDELRNKPKRPEPSKTLLKPYLQEHPECDFAHLESVLELKYKV